METQSKAKANNNIIIQLATDVHGTELAVRVMLSQMEVHRNSVERWRRVNHAHAWGKSPSNSETNGPTKGEKRTPKRNSPVYVTSANSHAGSVININPEREITGLQASWNILPWPESPT